MWQTFLDSTLAPVAHSAQLMSLSMFSVFLQMSQRPACCLPSFSLRRCHGSRSFILCPSILSVLFKVLFCSRFTGWWRKKSLCFMDINGKKLLVRLPGPRAYHVLPKFISTKTPEWRVCCLQNQSLGHRASGVDRVTQPAEGKAGI